jgi:hypothetical protein
MEPAMVKPLLDNPVKPGVVTLLRWQSSGEQSPGAEACLHYSNYTGLPIEEIEKLNIKIKKA